jgi:hypothetical protein
MEKRNTIRVPFHVRSVIKHADKIIEGEVINLSTGGMLFGAKEVIAAGETVSISIFLYGSSSHLTLNITGTVVRQTKDSIALKFTELDLDSFIHLKNIVSHNMVDDDKSAKDYKKFKYDESSVD